MRFPNGTIKKRYKGCLRKPQNISVRSNFAKVVFEHVLTQTTVGHNDPIGRTHKNKHMCMCGGFGYFYLHSSMGTYSAKRFTGKGEFNPGQRVIRYGRTHHLVHHPLRTRIRFGQDAIAPCEPGEHLTVSIFSGEIYKIVCVCVWVASPSSRVLKWSRCCRISHRAARLHQDESTATWLRERKACVSVRLCRN